MRIKPFIITVLCLIGLMSAKAQSDYIPQVIPMPQEATYQGGRFALPKQLAYSITADANTSKALSNILHEYLGREHRLQRRTQSGVLQLKLNKRLQHSEGYTLNISSRQITIEAKTRQGFRYALETLSQMRDAEGRYPLCTIKDSPRFAYRGVMLDVSRHFFPADYIKSLISEMARLKLNRFHWHLVDGGGWRMESKHYPLLTQKSAYRTESDWDKWWHGGDRQFTTADKGYGGYYTQEEIKDVVAHASKLGVTIVPEIEMPGHSTELIHAYPDLICPTATYKDASDVCIGNEATFTFFERILDETMALFPSKYIHIGGDEAAMNHWGNCPRCKQRMTDEKLSDLHALQSYMIRRIEKYLNSKGRKLIGWDEILMGGLAPDATVMSWRGEDGGIAAAKAGHDVIMTPNGNLYLDYYQSEAADEPRAIGGYVPLEKVYRYNPTPQSLNKEEQKHILGVQANLWTEYVYTPEHVSYMLFPRVLALAEVAWTDNERKDYNDFRRRATNYLPQLTARGHKPYPMNGITVHQTYNAKDNSISLQLLPERTDAVVRLAEDASPTASDKALDPTTPYIYKGQMPRDLKANVFVEGKRLLPSDRVYRMPAHLAIGSSVQYHSLWNKKYPAGELSALVDGLYGTPTYLDGRWQGFTEPMDVTLTLKESQKVQGIELRFMAEREQWVYMPKTVEVLISQDGTTFESLGTLEPKTRDDEPRPVFERFVFESNKEAKYIRVKASIGRSQGHFIFCDEVVVF